MQSIIPQIPHLSDRFHISATEQLVQNMIEEKKLILDQEFDHELTRIKCTGDFWVEAVDDPATKFCGLSCESSDVQPFFIDIMTKFSALCTGDKTVYTAGLDGKYNVATKLGIVTCIPDASMHNMPTVGRRKPDVNIYYGTLDIKSTLRIVSCWELKSQVRRDSFSPDEIGHVIDTNMELMRQQPFRKFTLAVLSDGVRFVFFKIIRLNPHQDDYIVLQSSVHLKMVGWAVAFALLLQPPAYFGYMHFDMAEFSIDKIIGQGAHTYVFKVSRGNEEPCALKVFENLDEYDTELSNLNRLHGILQNKLEFNHVPKIMNFQMMVTETISGKKYGALMSLPLCVPIRPERGGRLLRSSHFLQLLSTLEAVHAGGMFNCDIKPSNVMMHGDNVVLCDWGSAVFTIGNNPLPKHTVGTIGYCDFTLIKPSPPDASHDLMALVRTVYANYTFQHVSSDQNTANEFWEANFRSIDSMWTEAMNYAREVDYAKLREMFLKL